MARWWCSPAPPAWHTPFAVDAALGALMSAVAVPAFAAADPDALAASVKSLQLKQVKQELPPCKACRRQAFSSLLLDGSRGCRPDHLRCVLIASVMKPMLAYHKHIYTYIYVYLVYQTGPGWYQPGLHSDRLFQGLGVYITCGDILADHSGT